MFTSHLGRAALACAAVVSLSVTATAATAGALSRPTARFSLVTASIVAPSGSKSLGTKSTTSTMTFSVYLSSSNATGLAQYAAAVTNSHSSIFGHYLAPGQFASRFGAGASALSSVQKYLSSQGLSVSSTVTDGLALHVTGSVASINRAFHTTITRYQLANGSLGTAAVHGVSVPSGLRTDILGVVGLDNLTRENSATKIVHHKRAALSHLRWPKGSHLGLSFSLRTHSAPGAPSSCASAVQATQRGGGGITDSQVAHAYGADALYSAGDLASTQTIAVYELEPFSLADVKAFDQCYFGADHTSNITTINVDGGPGTGTGSGESALDIDNVSALAPNAHIEVYQAPNSTVGALDAYGQIVADDTAKIVTTSWGLCEAAAVAYSPASLQVEHVLFEQAAAQGQTVFAAAGDSGSNDCAGHNSQPTLPLLSVDDPAAQPYVVSVGGTTAVTVAKPPAEQVWNDGAQGGAGGGGTSSLWQMPTWQAMDSAVTSTSPSNVCGTGHSACRITPDVSAFADEFTGITISYAGSWYTIGGTSSSAPIWAALLAEVNGSSYCTSNPSTANGVGFVSPLLYEVGSNPTLAAQGFNDVTLGNNDVFSVSSGSYGAKVGYDAASGLGSPNLTGPSNTGLASSLCHAAQNATSGTVSAIFPGYGNSSGNTKVLIAGTGFMTGATNNVANVYFGEQPAAHFTVNSAIRITAYTPAEVLPSSVATPASSGGESLVAVTLTSGHTDVGPTFSYLSHSGSHRYPVVSGVGPNGGPNSGANQVNLYGSGFTGATTVTFGGVAATSFVVKSDSMIRAVAPPQGAASCLAHSFGLTSGLCQTVVVVRTALGTSLTVTPLKPLQGPYSYNNLGVPVAPSLCHCELYPTRTEYDFQSAPTISSVTNQFKVGAAFSPYGGDYIIVHGTGFNWLTLNALLIGSGSTQVQEFSVSNVKYTSFSGYTTADPTPSPQGNTTAVYANSLGGTSSAALITYGAVPRIDTLSGTLLPSSGAMSLVLTGSGFSNIQYVAFSSPFGLPSTAVISNFHVDSPTQITVTTPSLTPGSYQVTVGNSIGDSGLYSNPYIGPAASYQTVPVFATNVIVTYPGAAALTSASGTTCSVVGGCSIVLSGVNLGPQVDITIYVGPYTATITNDVQVAGVDFVTATVPAAYQGIPGAFIIYANTDNGRTPSTLTALETYV